MLLPAPPLDARSADEIMEESRALAPFYTPEWQAQATQGAGFALLQNFAQLLFDVVQHLNLAPAKNFAAFLARLGITLQPARPARVPLTFLLAPGTPQNVFIPVRTQAAAEATDTRPAVVFETAQNVLATIATLQAVYSVRPLDDTIYEHLSGLQNLRSSQLFAGRDLQEHSIYFAHSELFNLKTQAEVHVQFVISASQLTPADFINALSWEWWNRDHWVPSTVPALHEVLRVFPDVPTLQGPISSLATTISVTTNVESDARFPEAGLLLIDDEIVAYGRKTAHQFTGATRGWGASRHVPGASAAVQHGQGAQVRPLDTPLLVHATVGAAQNGRQVVTVSLQKDFDAVFTPSTVNGIADLWIRGRTLKNPTLQGSPLRNLQLDTVRVCAAGTEIDPEALFSNDVPLALPAPPTAVYPFGTRPRTFDAFYVASGDALSKRGGAITLSFGITLGGIASLPVRQVQGIGPTFASRLQAQGIDTVEKLLDETPERLARILGSSQIRALNILEAAQKEFYDKTSIFRAIAGVAATAPLEELMLSWEYWDGNGWQAITQLTDLTNKLRTAGVVTFPCPENIATASVNGQENYWMRTRIISGDYGKERFTFDGRTVTSDTSQIHPPIIHSLKIEYASAAESVDRCLTYNNLTFTDRTQNAQSAGALFQPFEPPEEDKPTVYLGFDTPLVSGPIRIFFSLVKQEYLEATKPRLQWQYWNGSAWVLLDVLDDTDSLTRSGLLQLVGPADLAASEKFGRQLFWLRAVDVENRFQSPPQVAMVQSSAAPASSGLLPIPRVPGMLPEKPCPELLDVFHPKFSVPAALSTLPPAPILQGILPNTTWALQAETIRDEILGSSDGQALPSYTLLRNPVVSEEIWVNEINALTEEESKKLAAQEPTQIEEERDEQGHLTHIWVRWRTVEDFLASTPTSRDYVIDRVLGTVQFGDGIRGMVPPIGVDNIKANYQFGGGAQGNVEAGTVISLKTSVAGVDKVTNHEPAGGGADTEGLDQALERGPQGIKHRNRAIAREDFEWLARQASNDIAKVKCLPTTNQNGMFETGWVAVIIAPHSQEAQPLPSAELVRQVQRYLADHCPNVVAAAQKLLVTGPAYVEVSVTADVFATSIDVISQVQSDSIKRLKTFLHPLTGGPEGTGWDFGRLVCLSDLIALLEALPNVDHVDHVTMQLRDVKTNTASIITDEVLLSATLPSYAMIFSGEHNVTVTFQAQR